MENKMYRFQAKVSNVYAYSTEIDVKCNVSTIASYKNEVSGWVKEENLEYAKEKFSKVPLRFIEANKYWANESLYQKGEW